MSEWIEDPQGRPEVEKVTKEMKLPVWKANYKGKFRDFWNELWDKIEDYVVKLKGDTEKKSKGLNDRLVSAVGKHDGDFPIENAVVGNVYYSELTKKYYKCKIGGPAPMPNGNFIDMSILENLNRLENLYSYKKFEFDVINTHFEFNKIGNIVIGYFYMNGVNSNSISTLTKVGTIPEEFRPKSYLTFMGNAHGTPAIVEIKVTENGEIFLKRTQGSFSFGTIVYFVNNSVF